MTKEILVLFLVMCTFICTIQGQDKRMLLIKEAVRFRTSIDKQPHNLTALDTCSDMGCVAAFAGSTNIERLDIFVNNWQKSAEFRRNDLGLLSQNILKDLTGGDKAARKTDFKEEFKALTFAIHSIITPSPDSTGRSSSTSPPAGNSSITTHELDSGKVVKRQTDGKLSSDNKLLAYSSLALSIIALTIAILLFRKIDAFTARNANANYEGEKSAWKKEHDPVIEELKKDMRELKLKLLEIPASVPSGMPLQATASPETAAQEIKSTVEEVEVKYAKSSINGGFSSADLKNRQNGECIFELHIKDNNAILKLSDDKKIHQYALNMNPEYYFTKEICNIRGLPAANKNITVNQDGTLAYDNSNSSWLITKKISLTFD